MCLYYGMRVSMKLNPLILKKLCIEQLFFLLSINESNFRVREGTTRRIYRE